MAQCRVLSDIGFITLQYLGSKKARILRLLEWPGVSPLLVLLCLGGSGAPGDPEGTVAAAGPAGGQDSVQRSGHPIQGPQEEME